MVNTLNQNFCRVGDKIVVRPTMQNEAKNPLKVDLEMAAKRHPNPMSAKIRVEM